MSKAVSQTHFGVNTASALIHSEGSSVKIFGAYTGLSHKGNIQIMFLFYHIRFLRHIWPAPNQPVAVPVALALQLWFRHDQTTSTPH